MDVVFVTRPRWFMLIAIIRVVDQLKLDHLRFVADNIKHTGNCQGTLDYDASLLCSGVNVHCDGTSRDLALTRVFVAYEKHLSGTEKSEQK